jgi:hypothetical protein
MEVRMLPQPLPPTHGLGGTDPNWSDDDAPPVPSKMPRLTVPPQGGPPLDPTLQSRLDQAWVDYSERQYGHIEKMFEETLSAFMVPYRITVILYVVLFGVGVVLFSVAAYLGLHDGSSVVAVAFGGLSVTMFLAFFIRQPLQALEEKLELITWLGVAFNTYWVRLMYMQNADAAQQEVQAAAAEYYTTVEQIIDKHEILRGKNPGADVG